MSRIGKLPVQIPEGVTIQVDGSEFGVSGPKGNLKIRLPKEVSVEVRDSQVNVSIKSETRLAHSLHGTIRALIANMVKGVKGGWLKQLELVGTGYRAEVSGPELVLSVGYSHPIKIKAPEGVFFKVEKNVITVEGADKEMVGQISAKIRSVRPPEPYKGKGISYKGEVIRRKVGKAAKAATT